MAILWAIVILVVCDLLLNWSYQDRLYRMICDLGADIAENNERNKA